MIKAPITCPKSLPEAIELLTGNPGALVLAGGTDLLIQMKKKAAAPTLLVSLRAIDELREVNESEHRLRLGATLPLATLAESADIADSAPLIAAAARVMASPPVRSQGTLGGNLCHASPAADLAPPLLVHEAVVVLFGPQGERKLPLSAFLLGPGATAL